MSDIPKQYYARQLGESGCYYSCLLRVAEIKIGSNIDFIEMFGRHKKYFESSDNKAWIDNDCYVNYPAKIINNITKSPVTVEKTFDLNYKPKENEFLIGCFERVTTGTIYYHFGVLNDNKECIWDPLGSSMTIKFGKLVSLRVVRFL